MGKYNKNNKILRIEDFQHPADKKAVDKIVSLPGFEKAINFISEKALERYVSMINNASYLKITPEMSPKLHEMLAEAADMYGCTKIPKIFLKRNYNFCVDLGGINDVHIFLPTTWLEVVNDDMLFAVLSAQIAAIQAKQEIMYFLIQLFDESSFLFYNNLFSIALGSALKLALSDWERMRIYTADRAVLLASESFELAAKHILFGDVPIDSLDKLELSKPGNTYYQQAKEFLQHGGAAGAYQKGVTAMSDSQWIASRYIELYNWYYSGEYHDVLERSIPE